MTASAMLEELFFSCALIMHNTICSQFKSWVAEAMGVKFLPQGNNSSRKPQLAWNLAITRQMPWQSARSTASPNSMCYQQPNVELEAERHIRSNERSSWCHKLNTYGTSKVRH